MREEARAVSWIDNLEDRSEPDHVEALLALGKLHERAACSSTSSGADVSFLGRGSMPDCHGREH